jgi:hypothetical protein
MYTNNRRIIPAYLLMCWPRVATGQGNRTCRNDGRDDPNSRVLLYLFVSRVSTTRYTSSNMNLNNIEDTQWAIKYLYSSSLMASIRGLIVSKSSNHTFRSVSSANIASATRVPNAGGLEITERWRDSSTDWDLMAISCDEVARKPHPSRSPATASTLVLLWWIEYCVESTTV